MVIKTGFLPKDPANMPRDYTNPKKFSRRFNPGNLVAKASSQ